MTKWVIQGNNTVQMLLEDSNDIIAIYMCSFYCLGGAVSPTALGGIRGLAQLWHLLPNQLTTTA